MTDLSDQDRALTVLALVRCGLRKFGDVEEFSGALHDQDVLIADLDHDDLENLVMQLADLASMLAMEWTKTIGGDAEVLLSHMLRREIDDEDEEGSE